MTNEQLQLIPALLRTTLGSEIPVVNDRIVYVVRAEMNESRSTGRNSGRRVRKSEWVYETGENPSPGHASHESN